MNHSSFFREIVTKRRSTRTFSSTEPVANEVISEALDLAQLSPNSSNMQLWEFHWIRSAKMLEQMVPLCMGQSAARTASHLVVFVTRHGLWPQRAAWNFKLVASAGSDIPEKRRQRGLVYYRKLVPLLYRQDFFGFWTLVRRLIILANGLRKPFIRIAGLADQRVVLHKSCALAAQTFMLAISAAGYDTCPMEGFDAKRVHRLLTLPRDAEITMIVAVGMRTVEGIHGPRLRVPSEEIVLIH